MQVIMLTCGLVLILTCAAFFIYEVITYRDLTRHELSTLAKIVADNSSAAVAFDARNDADETLGALKSQPSIVAASLYDEEGTFFAKYPQDLDQNELPKTLGKNGFHFRKNFLEGFEPIVQGNIRVGTLFIRSNLDEVYNRFYLYVMIAIAFIAISFVFAYYFSKRLQKTISYPILELAETANVISTHKDYSVRAVRRSNDELGILTQAFNDMLAQIQSQSEQIKALNVSLEEKVRVRTSELEEANVDLVRQKEFIEKIIDSSIDIVAVFDKTLRYEIINKISEEIYHWRKEDVIGKNILDVFPGLKGSVMVDNLHRALRGEFIHDNAYQSIITGRYFENFFIPLTNKDGHTDRVLVIGHDITSIMQANEKLKTLNSELEESNRDLEQFAYVASHDLQEPLRKIQLFSQLSEKNIEDPTLLKNYLEKINTSAARMSDLIIAVLNYSRLSRTDHTTSPIDLNTVVANIRSDLELVIHEKQAIITTNHLPVINANPLQMHQVFLNLISNSLKFSERKPNISITSTIVSSQMGHDGLKGQERNNFIELVFRDNGIGFEQKYASQIFTIFQKLHSEKEYAGTGIGLALCKKIIENHGGTIHAESLPGEGTTFYIYLPSSIVVSDQHVVRAGV